MKYVVIEDDKVYLVNTWAEAVALADTVAVYYVGARIRPKIVQKDQYNLAL